MKTRPVSTSPQFVIRTREQLESFRKCWLLEDEMLSAVSVKMIGDAPEDQTGVVLEDVEGREITVLLEDGLLFTHWHAVPVAQPFISI